MFFVQTRVGDYNYEGDFLGYSYLTDQYDTIQEALKAACTEWTIDYPPLLFILDDTTEDGTKDIPYTYDQQLDQDWIANNPLLA